MYTPRRRHLIRYLVVALPAAVLLPLALVYSPASARPRADPDTGARTYYTASLGWAAAVVQADAPSCNDKPPNPNEGDTCGDPPIYDDDHCGWLGQWPCKDGERYDWQFSEGFYDITADYTLSCTLLDGFCVTPARLTLTGDEQMPGESVVGIEAHLDGVQVPCPAGPTCDLTLGDSPGAALAWRALSSHGDSSSWQSLAVPVDTSPPEVSIEASCAQRLPGSAWCHGPMTIQVSAADAGVGMAGMMVTYRGETKTVAGSTFTLEEGEGGVREVTVTAYDLAGYGAAVKGEVKIDGAPPRVDCVSGNRSQLQLEIRDDQSGVQSSTVQVFRVLPDNGEQSVYYQEVSGAFSGGLSWPGAGLPAGDYRCEVYTREWSGLEAKDSQRFSLDAAGAAATATPDSLLPTPFGTPTPDSLLPTPAVTATSLFAITATPRRPTPPFEPLPNLFPNVAPNPCPDGYLVPPIVMPLEGCASFFPTQGAIVQPPAAPAVIPASAGVGVMGGRPRAGGRSGAGGSGAEDILIAIAITTLLSKLVWEMSKPKRGGHQRAGSGSTTQLGQTQTRNEQPRDPKRNERSPVPDPVSSLIQRGAEQLGKVATRIGKIRNEGGFVQGLVKKSLHVTAVFLIVRITQIALETFYGRDNPLQRLRPPTPPPDMMPTETPTLVVPPNLPTMPNLPGTTPLGRPTLRPAHTATPTNTPTSTQTNTATRTSTPTSTNKQTQTPTSTPKPPTNTSTRTTTPPPGTTRTPTRTPAPPATNTAPAQTPTQPQKPTRPATPRGGLRKE